MTSRPRSAIHGRCGCGHVWPVVYLPMPLADAAEAMRRATCPTCGNTRDIKIANDRDVVLAQQRADGGADILTKHSNIAGPDA